MAALLSSWPLAIATFLVSALMIGTACSTPTAESKSLPLVIDFTTDESWRPLNDGVLGGLSEGRITWDEGMHWVGQTRLENNGGFSSVRAAWGEYNLDGLSSITIRCKGEGGPFKLTMEMSQRWWMPTRMVRSNRRRTGKTSPLAPKTRRGASIHRRHGKAAPLRCTRQRHPIGFHEIRRNRPRL